MCTAILFDAGDRYFGRNLDLEYSYGQGVVITPRQFQLSFRCLPPMPHHHAIIGMAVVREGIPLYFDATNEKGLSMAGLNFPDNARYFPQNEGVDNVAPFEFIPWILGQCATLSQARDKLSRMQLTDIPFSDSLPSTPLHWLIADQTGGITVESTADGLRVYDNPWGVLTNNPPYPVMEHRLTDYQHLTPYPPENRLSLPLYSKGLGAIGLPGDWSSPSRFVREVFLKQNALVGDGEEENVGQFFHLLCGVEQVKGATRTPDGNEITLYSSCCNMDRGIYYYTTYHNRRITAVDMHAEDLDGDTIVSYPLLQCEDICYQNR